MTSADKSVKAGHTGEADVKVPVRTMSCVILVADFATTLPYQ